MRALCDEEEKDFLKAKDYFELALFYLGKYHSTGQLHDTDINKAIEYYNKCIGCKNEVKFHDNGGVDDYSFNLSYNDFGLICITHFNDHKKAEENIKEAAFAEYSFAQNNLGLLRKFYLNDKEKAEIMYENASGQRFALSEFNLGYNREKEGKAQESIKYFTSASDHEDELLRYKHIINYDKRLELSKTFVICLANLKLVKYFLLKSKFDESRKYFIRIFAKIIDETDPFRKKINATGIKSIFKSLKSMIFCSKIIQNIHMNQMPKVWKSINHAKPKMKLSLLILKVSSILLFKMMNVKSGFINEIAEIVQIMESDLYQPPYLILFGRIMIKKQKKNKP